VFIKNNTLIKNGLLATRKFANMVEIGKIIELKLREKRYSIAEFARKLNTERSNVYNIFKRKTIDTGLLEKVGEILEHDFFQYFITAKTKTDIVSDKTNIYLVNSELVQMKRKMEALEAENADLRSRLRDKELIIELMRK
jgi:plasmid maintenance system antidote protein VapI